MRILLADDQREVRSGLKILLEQEPDLDIAGEAEGISELLLQTQRTQPDIVLVDWELSNFRIADVVPVLRALRSGLKIIALSGRPESCCSAMAAGVDGFVSKGDQPEKLIETIVNVSRK